MAEANFGSRLSQDVSKLIFDGQIAYRKLLVENSFTHEMEVDFQMF